MKKLRRLATHVACLLLASQVALAQGGPSNDADQSLRIPRFVQKAYRNKTRSSDGKPGPAYWQNRSVHKMRIRVAPPNRQVSGSEDITYFNNSPDELPSIVFRLYMNSHCPQAVRDGISEDSFLTSGIHIDEFQINGEEAAWDDPSNPDADKNVTGSTIHVIKLKKPLAPKSSIQFSIRWHFDLAEAHGWKEGAIDNTSYHLAYFFPRVSVYSDTTAWDNLPFSLGREFSNDFADFDLEVTAPRNYVVWATGDLLNPEEVLQPTYASRLAESLSSDKVLNIAQPEEIKGGLVTAQTDALTWKWKALNVPDVAVSLSNHFLWDAGSVVVDPATGRRASVQSAYSKEAVDFRSMVDFGKEALSWGSTHYPGVPYPYSKTTIVEGGADEEYPMMANDGSNANGPHANDFPNYEFTGYVAAHELLHSWFPFYMGINEKRFPFMDEGWTTTFEHLFQRDHVGVDPAIKQFIRFRVAHWALDLPGSDAPIITPHDTMQPGGVGFACNGYGKAALAFLALKDLMGDAAFSNALHAFMERWNGKHPLPWDMFNTFNDVSATNYNWFFRNWFYEPNYMDIGIGGVQAEDSGYRLDIVNTGGMAVPFDVVLVYADKSTETLHQTPAVWHHDGRRTQVKVATTKKLRSVTLQGGLWVDFAPQDNHTDIL